MQVGDLVREKARMQWDALGIVLAVDFTQKTGNYCHPYKVYFFSDGDIDWMREGFLEVVSENR